MFSKTKNGTGIPKLDGSVNYPDILWEGRNEPRRGFGADVSCYSLLMFRRDTSSGSALMDIWGLMALFGMGLVARFFFCWPLSMATRRLG
jgi:hypothetical protein